MTKDQILLTGVTGYVGGRLLEALKKSSEKRPIKALVRSPKSIPGVVTVQGDVLEKETLKSAFTDVEVAFYLIHSMGSNEDFSDLDRQAATNFGEAAAQAGVKRIIYLGGLGQDDGKLSPHLKSRQEVGTLLRDSAAGVQVIEFRASIIIGAGSLSYEMIKALVDRLPIMITPKWVWTKAQPIDIDDILQYLIQAIDVQVVGNPIFEIGGKDQVSYGEIMMEYGKQKGLRRKMINVPVLSPRLSSLWLGLVTPLYARVGRKLIESALNETVVHDTAASEVFSITPISMQEAITKAIKDASRSHNRWMDSQSSSMMKSVDWSKTKFGEQLSDTRENWVEATPEEVFKTIMSIGGNTGYYYGNSLWRMRGFLDLLMGGVGFRRGRRDPETLETGDVVDFWRVEELIPNEKLRLRAEMKVPGRAWLEFSLRGEGDRTLITQKAIFDPVGWFGKLYWAFLYPIHHLIFMGMLKGISKKIIDSKKPVENKK